MTKQKYGVIYKITNTINNKVYIGQTTRTFNIRYHNNIKKYANIYLKRSIEKYGINNFLIEEEFDVAYSKEELNEKEKKYIEVFKSNDYNYGYNLKSGGDNVGKIKGKYKADILLRQGVPIFCKTTCEIFLSIKDASDKYNIGTHSISNQCKGTAGKKELFFNKDINKYMEFQYYDVDSKKGGKKVPIICVTTGQRFYSISEASRLFDIKQSRLRSILKRKKNKLKNNELEFMYLYDYVCKNYGKMASLENQCPETLGTQGFQK